MLNCKQKDYLSEMKPYNLCESEYWQCAQGCHIDVCQLWLGDAGEVLCHEMHAKSQFLQYQTVFCPLICLDSNTMTDSVSVLRRQRHALHQNSDENHQAMLLRSTQKDDVKKALGGHIFGSLCLDSVPSGFSFSWKKLLISRILERSRNWGSTGTLGWCDVREKCWKFCHIPYFKAFVCVHDIEFKYACIGNSYEHYDTKPRGSPQFGGVVECLWQCSGD